MTGGPAPRRTLAARWIFPATSPPIRDGRITIAGETIVRVGAADPACPVDLDLGDAAIVPGFVNAHTHLELGPIPRDGAAGPEDEVAWLGRVIRARFASSPAATAELIARNLRSAIAAGTTALGDIATAGQSWAAVAAAPVWGTVYAEILGLSRGRGDQTWKAAADWLDAAAPPPRIDQARRGLSPHAPYSTAGRLYAAAAAAGRPLATHLAEMAEEREFLAHRSGPLRRFVEGLGAWDEAWVPAGPAPIDYLDADPMSRQSDWIVAHGNHFEPAEFARLRPDRGRPSGPRVAIAYCPRTHARFGHPPHPLRAMLAAGVVVCLGTDSLASSPSLSILDEVRFLHRHRPDVDGATLLELATIRGAWALRRDDRTGSLEPGKSADLAVLAVDAPGTADDPHRLWLADERPPLGTMFRGEFVAGRWAGSARVD